MYRNPAKLHSEACQSSSTNTRTLVNMMGLEGTSSNVISIPYETDTDNQATNRPETAQRYVKQSTIFFRLAQSSFQGQIPILVPTAEQFFFQE